MLRLFSFQSFSFLFLPSFFHYALRPQKLYGLLGTGRSGAFSGRVCWVSMPATPALAAEIRRPGGEAGGLQ